MKRKRRSNRRSRNRGPVGKIQVKAISRKVFHDTEFVLVDSTGVYQTMFPFYYRKAANKEAQRINANMKRSRIK